MGHFLHEKGMHLPCRPEVECFRSTSQCQAQQQRRQKKEPLQKISAKNFSADHEKTLKK
jgi:hypothetical protein